MVIVGAIVVIALFAILGYFFYQYVIISGETSDREICRSSVLLTAKSKILGQPLVDSLKCKTDFKTIKTDNVEDIKFEITKEMYDCWYQFGEHKNEFISDWGTKKSYVFVCSRIEFEEGISKSVPTVDGFREYWSEKELPLGKEQTFYDYFDGAIPQYDTIISTEETVYVAFIGTTYNPATEMALEDPIAYAYLSRTYFDETGLFGLVGALLSGYFYNPRYYGSLYIGNSGDILRYLGASIDDEDCINQGEVKPCIVGGDKIYGECAVGEKECLSNGKWGECRQILFKDQTVEDCTDGVDNDCDGLIDCADDDCPNGTPCVVGIIGGVCQNRRCITI